MGSPKNQLIYGHLCKNRTRAKDKSAAIVFILTELLHIRGFPNISQTLVFDL